MDKHERQKEEMRVRREELVARRAKLQVQAAKLDLEIDNLGRILKATTEERRQNTRARRSWENYILVSGIVGDTEGSGTYCEVNPLHILQVSTRYNHGTTDLVQCALVSLYAALDIVLSPSKLHHSKS